MLKSVLKTDSKDSFVVCPSSERGSRVFGVAKCFSESGGTWYDNQKEPSFSDEIYNAKLQKGRLCSGSTKRSKVSVKLEELIVQGFIVQYVFKQFLKKISVIRLKM